MRRGDPERIYQAQLAGFLGLMVEARGVRRERVEVVLNALEGDAVGPTPRAQPVQ
jgi:hypothetical protein